MSCRSLACLAIVIQLLSCKSFGKKKSGESATASGGGREFSCSVEDDDGDLFGETIGIRLNGESLSLNSWDKHYVGSLSVAEIEDFQVYEGFEGLDAVSAVKVLLSHELLSGEEGSVKLRMVETDEDITYNCQQDSTTHVASPAVPLYLCTLYVPPGYAYGDLFGKTKRFRIDGDKLILTHLRRQYPSRAGFTVENGERIYTGFFPIIHSTSDDIFVLVQESLVSTGTGVMKIRYQDYNDYDGVRNHDTEFRCHLRE